MGGGGGGGGGISKCRHSSLSSYAFVWSLVCYLLKGVMNLINKIVEHKYESNGKNNFLSYYFNPLRAKFFRGNKNIYFHFVLLLPLKWRR